MDQGAIIDRVFIALKWNGFYQTSRTAVLLLSLANLGLTAVSVVFIGKAVDHKCRQLQSFNITIQDVSYDIASNSSSLPFEISYTQCSVDVRNGSDLIFTSICRDGYEYNVSMTSSFVAEWDLVCNEESFSDFSQTVLVLGEMFGSLFLTRFADRYGRKVSFIATSLVFLAANMTCAVSPNFIFYLVFRFITGLSVATCYQLSYILMIEMMPTAHRALPEKLCSFLWSISLLCVCLVAYLTKELSWHYTQLCLSLFAIYVIFLWWITDESIRWLCAVKRYKEVEDLVKKIARINQVDPQEALDILKTNLLSPSQIYSVESDYKNQDVLINPAMNDAHSSHPDKKLSVFIKNTNLLKLTVFSSYTWFVDSLVYDGLLLISPNLNDDFYLGFLLGVVTELPATLSFCLLINRIGRKKCTVLFHILAGIFILVSTLILNTPLYDMIPGQYWICLVLALLGRLSVTAGFSTTLTYVSELFPTSVRNTGMGFASVALYLGSTIAPYSRTITRHVPWAPNVVFGIMYLTVTLAILFLPETCGHELAQTVNDMDQEMQKRNQ
ncbi:solute carrier family 22 member 6-like isoform X2 [Biomphalaria glabrata]|nr:solute carrier family 22 member 6-like isoform X2 [Biomphalaria glabrata]XP_055893255.1 solute carrier family 22 member 6-like isoform X2 [Biomphalaria glabrata]XP_055893256.1 solute carrier family 22 member 6-like isoform X2 [Biomphalaria glabrata]